MTRRGLALFAAMCVIWGIPYLLIRVAVCYAVGPSVPRRGLSDAPPLGVIAVSIGIAALVYAPFAALSLPDGVPSWKVSASVLGLAVICTALAFVVFFQLIGEVGPV